MAWGSTTLWGAGGAAAYMVLSERSAGHIHFCPLLLNEEEALAAHIIGDG